MNYDNMSKEMLTEILMQKNNRIEELMVENKKLNYLASIDGMTGALNKKSGLDFLEREFKLTQSKNKNLVVCFIDVDGLKTVNDNFGHEEGDKLLISLTKILKEGIRKTDFVIRIGGDEFLIVFPETTMQEANKVLGRILKLVEKFNQNYKKYSVGFSYGFYDYIKNIEENNCIDKIIKCADVEMYKMKREKRRI